MSEEERKALVEEMAKKATKFYKKDKLMEKINKELGDDETIDEKVVEKVVDFLIETIANSWADGYLYGLIDMSAAIKAAAIKNVEKIL